MMDGPFEIVEQNDGYTSPLQQYGSFEASSTVSQPTGPMWWTPGDVEPVVSGDVEITPDYDGGVVTLPTDPPMGYEIPVDGIITVLE